MTPGSRDSARKSPSAVCTECRRTVEETSLYPHRGSHYNIRGCENQESDTVWGPCCGHRA